MGIGEILHVLARHWRISLTAFLLVVAATVATYVMWPASYESDAEISLISPDAVATQQAAGNNPFLDVGGLSPMAGILASSLSSQQSTDQLQSLGVNGSFTATLPPLAAGPFVELSVTGNDAAVVRKSMPIVLNFSEKRLEEIQQEGLVNPLNDSLLIKSVVIAQPSAPHLMKKNKYQVAVGVAIFGTIAVVVLSLTVEARSRRRHTSLYQKVDDRKVMDDARQHRMELDSSSSTESTGS